MSRSHVFVIVLTTQMKNQIFALREETFGHSLVTVPL